MQSYNVHTIALQVPIKDLTRGGGTPDGPDQAGCGDRRLGDREPAEVRRFDKDKGKYVGNGPWEQVSRLGNPLFNEVIVPMAEKDLWNARPPRKDSRYAKYVNKPELGRPAAGALPGRLPEAGGLHEAAGRPERDPADRHPQGVVPGSRTTPGRCRRTCCGSTWRSRRRRTPNDLGLVGRRRGGLPQRSPDRRRRGHHRAARHRRATIPLVDPSYTPDGAASAVQDGTTNTNAAVTETFPYLGLPGGGYQTVPGTTQAS